MSTTTLPSQTVTATVPTTALRAALVTVKRHAAPFGPARKAVFVAVEDGAVTVTAGDDTGAIAVRVPGTVTTTGTCMAAVDAAALQSALKGTRGPVTVTVDADAVTVTGGPIPVRVPAVVTADHPPAAITGHRFAHTAGTSPIPAARLAAFRRYCAKPRDWQPVLQCLHLSGDRMAATNRYMLAAATDRGYDWPTVSIDPGGVLATVAERGGGDAVFLSVDAAGGWWHADNDGVLAWGVTNPHGTGPNMGTVLDGLTVVRNWWPADGLAAVCEHLAKQKGHELTPLVFTVGIDGETVTATHDAAEGYIPAGRVAGGHGFRWALTPAYAAVVLTDAGDRSVNLPAPSTDHRSGASLGVLKPLWAKWFDIDWDATEIRVLMPVRVS